MATRETHRAGKPTLLTSNSSHAPFAVSFEDDGETGYFYALDLRIDGNQIVDAVHIYNVASIVDAQRESDLEIVWSNDGTKSALIINKHPHAVFDFSKRRGYCRTDFPNFPQNDGDWCTATHKWEDGAMQG